MKKISEPKNIFPIGYNYTDYRGRGCEVVNHLRTFDSDNNLVRFRYVVIVPFAGQIMTFYDVVHTSILIAVSK